MSSEYNFRCMLKNIYKGFCDYEVGLKTHNEGPINTIYGFEHPSTITLGIRGKIQDDMPFGEFKTQLVGFKIHKVDRGGHATLHNPGQLVIYPKIHLPDFGLTVREFVDLIQNSTVQLLKSYGIKARTKCEPGIYINEDKIAFLGLRIKKGTAHHGLSININNDLSQFQWIRSCGVNHAPMTSLNAQGLNFELKDVFSEWVLHFENELSLTQLPGKSTLATNNLRV
jgi:lipoyl(octanoyl) transferase